MAATALWVLGSGIAIAGGKQEMLEDAATAMYNYARAHGHEWLVSVAGSVGVGYYFHWLESKDQQTLTGQNNIPSRVYEPGPALGENPLQSFERGYVQGYSGNDPAAARQVAGALCSDRAALSRLRQDVVALVCN
jgi:hypothetical protein